MNESECTQTPEEWLLEDEPSSAGNEQQTGDVNSTQNLGNQSENSILYRDLNELAKKYDGFDITALVHRTSTPKSDRVKTAPSTATTTLSTSSSAPPISVDEQRKVTLPNLMAIKTIYDCSLCGSLLSEQHFYTRDMNIPCLRHEQQSSNNNNRSRIVFSKVGDDINIEDIVRENLLRSETNDTSNARPLYEIPDGEFLNQNIEEIDDDLPIIDDADDEQPMNKESSPPLLFDYLTDNAEDTFNEIDFIPYTGGLNRMPPLYSGRNNTNSRRRQRNCFNSRTKPGALPHLSKQGLYYRFVNYDKQIPDLMSMTITNPRLIGNYRNNDRRRYPNRYGRFGRRRNRR